MLDKYGATMKPKQCCLCGRLSSVANCNTYLGGGVGMALPLSDQLNNNTTLALSLYHWDKGRLSLLEFALLKPTLILVWALAFNPSVLYGCREGLH